MRTPLILSTLLLTTSAFAAPAKLGPPLQSPSTGDAQFAARAYQQLSRTSGNLFFSPASMRIALSMALEGARGETAAELRTALSLAGDSAAASYAALLKSWDELAHPKLREPYSNTPEAQRYVEEEAARKRVVLKVANRLWIDKSFHLLPAYAAVAKESYRAEPALVDYKHDAEGARAAINRWVAESTENKIPQLIPPHLLSADMRLVLTNAIYFKAQWQEPFPTYATKEEPFFVDAKTQVKARLMHHASGARLGDIEGGQILELAYGGGDIVMDVVLPTKVDGLPALEQAIAGEKGISHWLASLRDQRVMITLPRWKTRSEYSLTRMLGALGVKAAFKFPGADFSGIDGSKQLYFSEVLHQAVVEVDEHGTEAAAATAVMMKAGAAPQKVAEFRADHPFLYFIRDARSNVILFVGRLTKPE